MAALRQSYVYENDSTVSYQNRQNLLPLDLSTKKTSLKTANVRSASICSFTNHSPSIRSPVCSPASQLANFLISHLKNSPLPSPCGSESGKSFSSCCSGAPSPISWLRNDDSGYAESTDSRELVSSYCSPLSHLQIELAGVFDDVLEDITTDVESDSLRGNLIHKENIHNATYLYVTASKGATFPEKRQHHRKRRHEQKKHECQLCGERLATRSNLLVHMRRHTGVKPYECEFCGKRFAQRSSMRTHMRTHTKERPYACTACPKTFRDYSTFTKHYRIHTGQRPYSCNVCGKAFAQSGNLNRHRATHINEPWH